MRIRFWGVRGSTPTPLRQNLGYGGNTPCLELRTKAGNLFIFDCGTGFRELGRALQQAARRKTIQARVFLTHYHWDHIQGIPFFTPLYEERNQFMFHCPRFDNDSVQEALEGQMMTPYFPVDMGAMRAHRRFFELEEERVAYDELTITTRRLHHPQGCLGYRLECDGKVLAYCTDNEPGDRQGDENVRRLAEGADVLIYDAQYTPKEMEAHKNWGHSNWKEGVRIATECKVRKLVLFHHDPDRDDRSLARLLKRARNHFAQVVAAKEGMVVKL